MLESMVSYNLWNMLSEHGESYKDSCPLWIRQQWTVSLFLALEIVCGRGENGKSHGTCTGGGKESLFSLTGIQNLCITQVSCPVGQECAPSRGGKVPWDLYSPGNGTREWKWEGSERRAGCRLQSPQLHCFLGPTEFHTARGVCWLICCFTHAQPSALCRWGGLGNSRSQQILFKWIDQSVTNKRTGPRDRMMAVCMYPFAQIWWMATLRALSPFSIPGASPMIGA